MNKFKDSAKQMIKDQQNYAVPARDLSDLEYVDIKSYKDFELIPKDGGAYWIATDEHIKHSTNKYDDQRVSFNGLEVIYNGMSSSGVRGRIMQHLNRIDKNEIGGQSGISIEPSCRFSQSHSKKLLHPGNGHSLYFNGKRIRTIEQINEMDLPKEYMDNINEAINSEKNKGVVYMRNGIDVLDEFHSKYTWRVYFLTGVPHEYADFVERKWRVNYGQPRLNTYISGR